MTKCEQCDCEDKNKLAEYWWIEMSGEKWTLCEDCGIAEEQEKCELENDVELQETPEQRAERIFKEDEEAYEMKEQKELQERRLKRIAVVEKYKGELDAMIVGKQKAIRWRKYFHAYVFNIAKMEFETEEDEYKHIGKAGRSVWTDHHEMDKAFNKTDIMHGVIEDIMREFGCFEY